MGFVINPYSIIALLVGLLLGFLLKLYLVLILGIIAVIIFLGICFSNHSPKAEGGLAVLFFLVIDALFSVGLFLGVAPSLPWDEWFNAFGMAHAYLSEFFKSYVFR